MNESKLLNKFGDEVFQCNICKNELELEFDKPIRLSGNYDDMEIHIDICEYCACGLAGIEGI